VPIGETFALAAASCWAVGSVLFARIGKTVSPAAMNLMKCLTAATLLAVARLALSSSIAPLAVTASSALLLALSAVVGLTVGDTAYFEAMARIGVPRAILLLSAAPVFATVGGALLLDERVTARTIAGIAVTLTGIGLAVTSRDDRASTAADERPRDDLRAGVGYGLLAALCQAAGQLVVSPRDGRRNRPARSSRGSRGHRRSRPRRERAALRSRAAVVPRDRRRPRVGEDRRRIDHRNVRWHLDGADRPRPARRRRASRRRCSRRAPFSRFRSRTSPGTSACVRGASSRRSSP
jgi:drug/metabolite transporter (DMT)-like permease